MEKQKYKINQISKALDKLFAAGFNTQKKIANMKVEDLREIKNLSQTEINIIIDFKIAIKEKRIVNFLTGIYDERS